MKFILLNKKIIIVAIIAITAVSAGSYKLFFTKKEPSYNFALVRLGNVVREVSATGQVEKGELIDIGFKETGRIEEIYVKVGDEVEAGKELMKIETSQLFIQLTEARAAFDLAQAELNKLLAGATSEEIKIARTKVENAEISLANANQDLEDEKNQAEDNLDAAYEDALNVLEDAYLKIYNAFTKADSVQRTYFNANDQESSRVKEKTLLIEEAKIEVKTYLDAAKASSTNENIDVALSHAEDALNDTYGALETIRNTCEEPSYRNVVSDSDKTALDNNKSYVNTSLTSVINSKQTISSTKLTNESSINTAQGVVDSAEGALKASQDELARTIAGPRKEDIDLYQAKAKQAKSKVSLLENQIWEATLRSPIKGQITKIDKRAGEQVSASEGIVSLIPKDPFQIELDISESDIGRIEVGDPAKITLDAFPEEEFSGKVIEIEPAETMISGVVYYETKVSLETEDTKIKPGMTAEVVITADFKENVLIIPQRAVTEKENKKFVKLVKDNDVFEETEIQIGLKGSEGDVEVLSGLKEGDKVVTFLKEK